MKKEETILETEIQLIAEKFIEKIQDKEVQIISHFDTDGITSATIMIQTLKQLDKKFSLKIVKRLEEDFIYNLPKNKITLFLDLASGSLHHIAKHELKNVFIIDHHELTHEIPDGIQIINPELKNKQKISSAGLTFLFCKHINPKNKESTKLAVLGMIGDLMEKNIDKLNNNILNEGEVNKKRGLLIYPSTRPLNRTLEYSSKPYIPGVTGNTQGVIELLREIELKPKNGKYKSLIELNEKEMQKLITAIMLRNPKLKSEEIIGDIFLIKLFNKLEDAREISAMINACSRLGKSELAIQLCMENSKIKKMVESTYAKYKQFIITGLKLVSEIQKIQGKNFIIINAKDKIRDTIIGTIASILSNSSLYEKGTIITTMAYYDDKIKISSRNVGRQGRNVREILNNVVTKIGGEVGGHKCAAGCMIHQEKEEEFIELLKKNLEIEMVRI